MLRKISIALNAIVVTLSLCLFAYTFFAKDHLIEHTRGFVTEKTLSYSKPLVETTRVGLESPLAQKLVSEERRLFVESELATYDSDPVDYVTSLTSAEPSSLGTGKIAEFKEKVRGYYQSTLTELLRDLRIFSGANVGAGLFAIFLLFSPRFKESKKLVTFSFVIFTAVAYSTVSYIDGVSFLTILLKWHLGWGYPVVIILTILWLGYEFGLHKETGAESGRRGVLPPAPQATGHTDP